MAGALGLWKLIPPILRPASAALGVFGCFPIGGLGGVGRAKLIEK